MSISAVSSDAASVLQAVIQGAAPREAGEVRENDGDRDDLKGAAQASQPVPASAPTVNLSGQVIGQVINTQA